MLATMLLAGLVTAPLSVAGLAMPVNRRSRRGGRWPAAGRLVLAMAAISIVALVVAISLRLCRITGPDRDAGIASVVIANLAWLPVTRRWTARARVCWASSTFLITVYLAVALRQTLVSRSGTAGTAGGLLLWSFELFAAVLSCAYLWEICEALGTQQWRRRPPPRGQARGQAELAHPQAADWVLGTLGPDDAVLFQFHLRGCPHCQAAVARLASCSGTCRRPPSHRPHSRPAPSRASWPRPPGTGPAPGPAPRLAARRRTGPPPGPVAWPRSSMTSSADPREFPSMEITVQSPGRGAIQPEVILSGNGRKL
jgi:putative zinc finger protein